MPGFSPYSITYKCNGHASSLISSVKISHPFNPVKRPDNIDEKQVFALWDTGATHSVITEYVANECGLKPYTMQKVRHVNGEDIVPAYIISLTISDKIHFADLQVTQAMGILGDDIHVLIPIAIRIANKAKVHA